MWVCEVGVVRVVGGVGVWWLLWGGLCWGWGLGVGGVVFWGVCGWGRELGGGGGCCFGLVFVWWGVCGGECM